MSRAAAAAATDAALEVAAAGSSSADWPFASRTSSLSITPSCRSEWERFQYRGDEMEGKEDETAEIEIWDFQSLAKRRIFFSFFFSGLWR